MLKALSVLSALRTLFCCVAALTLLLLPGERPPLIRYAVSAEDDGRALTAALPTAGAQTEGAESSEAAQPADAQVSQPAPLQPPLGVSQARGYLTTPQELAQIRWKAAQGWEPYATAVRAELDYAATAYAARYPEAPQTINIRSGEIDSPAFLSQGSKYAYALALAHHLLKDSDPALAEAYARRAYDLVMTLPRQDTQVKGYQANTRLNLSVYIPLFVYAADLLADWQVPGAATPFHASADDHLFKEWLGRVIFRYPFNAAHTRVNNWGAWGRMAAAVIADYVGDAAPLYAQSFQRDFFGQYTVAPGTPCQAGGTSDCVPLSAGEAYATALRLHFEFADGQMVELGDASCDRNGVKSMIRPDGGLPDELRRQYTCAAASIPDPDGAASRYTQFAAEPMIALAELSWRRDNPAVYTYIAPDTQRGAVYRVILFMLRNNLNLRLASLFELANRFYTYQLGVEADPAKRAEFQAIVEARLPEILKAQGNWPAGALRLPFGTLTHGFSPGEALTSPPLTAPRASGEIAAAPPPIGDLRPASPPVAPAGAAEVAATVETEPVPGQGDAADDPAIWIHPADPALSTIIATDKRGGLLVYDLSGRQIQYLADGPMNNVDLRYNFPLGGQAVALVTATHREAELIAVYRVNPQTRLLESVSARPIALDISAYGLCMYRSPFTGKFYAFVNSERGEVEQWELFDNGQGQVDAARVRAFRVESQTEGCVADDELGHLYIGEEDEGVWRYGAEPGAGSDRRLVDSVSPDGHLQKDVEGLALYYAGNGGGYLIASSQGSDEYMLYRRGGDNPYVGTFRIVAGEGVDRVSETDGIEVTNFGLGTAFPYGVFVAQDGHNSGANQNFKLVPWEAIARAFEPALTVENTWDPRAVLSSGAGGYGP